MKISPGAVLAIVAVVLMLCWFFGKLHATQAGIA